MSVLLGVVVLAAAVGLSIRIAGFAYVVGRPFLPVSHGTPQNEPMQSNDGRARVVTAEVAKCLAQQLAQSGGLTYPQALRELGPSGTKCLSAEVAEGRLPGHRLEYYPSVVASDGRSAAYMVCAQPLAFGKTGWETVVHRSPDSQSLAPIDPGSESEAQGSPLGQPIGCAAAWGEFSFRNTQHCLYAFAAAHPDQGYPASVAEIGPSGSNCLADSRNVASIDGDVVSFGIPRYEPIWRRAYLPALPGADGRITRYVVAELSSDRRWMDQDGVLHQQRDGQYALFQRNRVAHSTNPDRLERQCREGNDDACLRWADSLLPRRRDPIDAPKVAEAIAAWKIACERRNPLACFRIAREYQSQRGWPPDRETCAALTTACSLGSGDACFDAAIHRAGNRCTEETSISVRDMLERACKGDLPKGCVALGRLLVKSGAASIEDLTRAAKFFERACDPLESGGCAPLAALYLDGQGRPKDRALARHFMRRACALAGDQYACGMTRTGGTLGPQVASRP